MNVKDKEVETIALLMRNVQILQEVLLVNVILDIQEMVSLALVSSNRIRSPKK